MCVNRALLRFAFRSVCNWQLGVVLCMYKLGLKVYSIYISCRIDQSCLCFIILYNFPDIPDPDIQDHAKCIEMYCLFLNIYMFF